MTQTITGAPESRYAQAGSFKLHYHEGGSGHPLLMLHGAGPGANGWGNYNRNFAAFAAKYRTIVPDHPGFGQSDPVVITDEPRDVVHARAFKDMLDTLDIERTHIVAHSMGGGVALRFAIEYPERLDRLVLICPSGGGRSIMQPTPSEGGKSLAPVLRDPTVDTLRRFVHFLVYDPATVPEELIERRYKAMMDRPEHLENFLKSMSAPVPVASDLSLRLQEVQASTLLLWGRDDRFAPLDHGLKFVWGIPDARLHIFSKSGHWPQYEHTLAFNQLVLNFLAG
jgi:pimeloyl-ACP methyl ester carboxylesterase